MKWGVLIALLRAAWLIAAVYLYTVIGFGAVFAAVARAGLGGLLLLCLCQLAVAAMLSLLPLVGGGSAAGASPGCRVAAFPGPPGASRRLPRFRLSRRCGGLVTAARLAMLYGMQGSWAAASVATDMTTEAMAQVPFLAFGVAPEALRRVLGPIAAQPCPADGHGGGAGPGGAGDGGFWCWRRSAARVWPSAWRRAFCPG